MRGLIPAHAGKTVVTVPRQAGKRAHPRSRGENVRTHARASWLLGSSPLTRGKPLARARGDRRRRLIPAHAGKTRPWPRPTQPTRAHPRSRGENGLHPYSMSSSQGSSPLTRGKPRPSGTPTGGGGLIPAHAGKTIVQTVQLKHSGAHPRSRGENPHFPQNTATIIGLIPAHAGKTGFLAHRGDEIGAHPRSRGENFSACFRDPGVAGSSPLTRGKPAENPATSGGAGLIPAHAGKTRVHRVGHPVEGAHPRSRGENAEIVEDLWP